MENLVYIDFEAFENRTMNDIEVQKELFDLSVSLFEQYHRQMIEAFKNHDFETIKGISHKAKTGASLMGMNNIGAEYQELERDINLQGNLLIKMTRIETLIHAFNECSERLKQYINSKK